jgi:hypothetical protein
MPTSPASPAPDAARVIPYFKELGYEFSAGNNPADELLDFVAGRDYETVHAAMPRAMLAEPPPVHKASFSGGLLEIESPHVDGGDSAAMPASPRPRGSGGGGLLSRLGLGGGGGGGGGSATMSLLPGVVHELPESSEFLSQQWRLRGRSYGVGVSLSTDMLVRGAAGGSAAAGSSPLPVGGSAVAAAIADAIEARPHVLTGSLNHADAADDTVTPYVNPDQISADRGASFFRQMVLAHNRSVLQQYRQYTTFALEIFVASLAGILMGAAASQLDGLYYGILKPPYTLISPAPIEVLLPSVGFYVSLAIGLAGSPAGVLTFGEEKLVYYREAAAGHNTLAYYIGKTLSVVYRFTLGAWPCAPGGGGGGGCDCGWNGVSPLPPLLMRPARRFLPLRWVVHPAGDAADVPGHTVPDRVDPIPGRVRAG